MDDIEKGFDAIFEQLDELNRGKEEKSRLILEGKAELLGKMAGISAPVVARVGLSMVNRAKLDARGEPYNAEYYPKKMLVLGKTEPMKYRPDDITKAVADQFCVLSEDGKFYEIMYSSTEVSMDSYLNPLTPEQVIDIYGLDIMFMLYRALRDYLDANRDLVDALGKVLVFVFGEPSGGEPAGPAPQPEGGKEGIPGEARNNPDPTEGGKEGIPGEARNNPHFSPSARITSSLACSSRTRYFHPKTGKGGFRRSSSPRSVAESLMDRENFLPSALSYVTRAFASATIEASGNSWLASGGSSARSNSRSSGTSVTWIRNARSFPRFTNTTFRASSERRAAICGRSSVSPMMKKAMARARSMMRTIPPR
ncbi:MAG TPA: hypothetical protein VMS81_00455 [Methanomicrobiales archaeon]|nr:hypothetical protein [Methanomicrobiales archaeon]